MNLQKGIFLIIFGLFLSISFSYLINDSISKEFNYQDNVTKQYK